jgi:hypothetical protein
MPRVLRFPFLSPSTLSLHANCGVLSACPMSTAHAPVPLCLPDAAPCVSCPPHAHSPAQVLLACRAPALTPASSCSDRAFLQSSLEALGSHDHRPAMSKRQHAVGFAACAQFAVCAPRTVFRGSDAVASVHQSVHQSISPPVHQSISPMSPTWLATADDRTPAHETRSSPSSAHRGLLAHECPPRQPPVPRSAARPVAR